MEKRWQDTCIIEQHRVWNHDVDVMLISLIMSSSHDFYDGSIVGQQNTLLLCLREQGKNCSHTLHDVAGGGDGIIFLAFNDREVLPSWEGLLMYCSIMKYIFDKEHVKEWSLILMRAYGYRPTALSLWSSDLWMKCA